MDIPQQKVKKLMIDHKRGGVIAELAREFEKKNFGQACSREQMSMCIHWQREYPEYQQNPH